MRFLTLSFLSIPAFFLLSCAGESKKAKSIDNDKIYQRYTSSYTEGSDGISVQAEFRIGAYWDRLGEEKTGGDAVELVSPDHISFNGQSLIQDNSVFTGTYYSLKKTGSYVPTQTWVWTDAKGKKYTNSFTLNPIKPKNVKFYGRDSVRIEWEGGPIEENEIVFIRFDGGTDDKNKKKTATERITTKGVTGITIGYELVRAFRDAAIDFEIERTLLIRAKESTSEEGTIKASYTSKSRALNSTKPLLEF